MNLSRCVCGVDNLPFTRGTQYHVHISVEWLSDILQSNHAG